MKYLYCVCIGLFCVWPKNGSTQNNENQSYNLLTERLYWNPSGQETEIYYMDRCPLDCFANYKAIFPIPISVSDVRGGDVLQNKNYYAEWEIIDSMLYLCNVHIDAFQHLNPHQEKRNEQKYLPRNQKYRAIEQLVGAPSHPLKGVQKSSKHSKPQGVIPATWFSGTILLKSVSCDYTDWLTTPFIRVSFEKGQITEVDQVISGQVQNPVGKIEKVKWLTN